MTAAQVQAAWDQLLSVGGAAATIGAYAQHNIDQINKQFSTMDLTDAELRSMAARIAVWNEIKQHTEVS